MRSLALALLSSVIAGAAHAACTGATNGTPGAYSALTNDFRDGQPAGSITPGCMRDLVASTYGGANNNVNLKNLGLPTGGDDTAAINAALASALPASFTGTGSISGQVLTVTGTPASPVAVGQFITTANVTPGTQVQSLGTGTGGAGTYNVSIPQTVASETQTFQPPAAVAVYAPAGVYKHAGVVVDNGVCLYGDGPSTVLMATDAVGNASSVELAGVNPCLRNLSVNTNWNGARQSNNTAQAVYVNAAVNYTVDSISVVGSQAGGIFQSAGTNGTVTNNKIYDTLADGIGNYYGTSFVTVANNYLSNVGDDCISVVSYSADPGTVTHITVTGNRCFNAQARGLSVVGGVNISEVGNLVQSALDSCVYVVAEPGAPTTQGNSGVTVGENVCINSPTLNTASYAALQVDGYAANLSSNVIINNNIVVSSQTNCLQVGAGGDYSKNVTFSNNNCYFASGNQGSGISVAGVTDVTVINNKFVGAGFYGVYDNNVGFNAGYANVEGNLCDDIATAGYGWCIYLPTETFAGIQVTNNSLYTDGGTNVQGLVTLSGVAAAVVDGNLGDNTSMSVSGITAGRFFNAYGVNIIYGTKFTASGCTNSTTVGQAAAGSYHSGTSGTCTVTLTFNGATGATAPNGWACSAFDQTTAADVQRQSASTPTTATITGTTASGDVIVFGCQPY